MRLDTDACSLMLLGRDMDIFCDVLMDGDVYIPGFGTKIAIKLAVAPGSTLSSASYKEPLSEIFSETTQRALLQPFRNRLRGFKKAKVRGLVDPDLARAVEKDISQDLASDTEAVLTDFQNQKNEAQDLYKAKAIDAACLKWMDAALEIDQLKVSSSWAVLVEKGGEDFVARLAEMYYLMRLNILHVKINGIIGGDFVSEMLAKDNLEMVCQSIDVDYWMPGYQWRPSDVQMAKLAYRQAHFFRLTDDLSEAQSAITSIQFAQRQLPDDANIARERTAVLAWASQRRL